MAKAIQQSTLYGYVNVERPRNFRIALEGINSKSLGFIKNPLYDDKFEESKSQKPARVLEVNGSDANRCTTNSTMRKMGLSCYFLISKTSVLLLFLCFIAPKVLLFFISRILLRGYSKQIDDDQYNDYLEIEKVF